MKGISVSLVAVAMTMMCSSLPMPCGAQPAPKVAGRQPIPKWFYYDQIGLREWHKGNKDRALNYFDQSYKLCKSALSGTKALDNRTKTMVIDVINHQQFHMGVWRATPENTAKMTDTRLLAINNAAGKALADDEKQMAFLGELETFAKRCLGPNHLMVQALARNRNLNMSDAQKKLYLEKLSEGKPTLGTVIVPKWYKQNDRDFTPELFTHSARKTRDRNTEDKLKYDVTRVPEVKQEKGISYVAGQRVDWTKKNPAGDPKNWGKTTVGSVENNDPKVPASGWGNGGQRTDQSLAEANKWGVTARDVTPMPGTKPKVWGQEKSPDPIQNKPWGNGGTATAEDLENANQNNLNNNPQNNQR